MRVIQSNTTADHVAGVLPAIEGGISRSSSTYVNSIIDTRGNLIVNDREEERKRR